MRVLLPSLFALLLAAGAWAADSGAWKLFTGTTGNFQILLPGPPTITHDSHSTYLGDVIGTKLETRTGPHRATLTHQDIPRIATTLMPDRIILERAGASLIEAAGGTQSRVRTSTWQGYSVRELSYEIPGDSPRLTRARLILVGSRIYMTIASWPAPDDIPTELTNFLDSFALTSPSETTPPVGAGTNENRATAWPSSP
jgi:hypothetical protein